jgi:hypothetical protein
MDTKPRSNSLIELLRLLSEVGKAFWKKIGHPASLRNFFPHAGVMN